MQKCIQIIKKNPGERKIRIGERIIEISDKWYEQLQSYIQDIS
jgi:hypothetical protein